MSLVIVSLIWGFYIEFQKRFFLLQGGVGTMFNMTKIKAVRGDGRSFYMNHLSSNDYYSEHEKVQGRWCGRLALEFDLWDAVSS